MRAKLLLLVASLSLTGALNIAHSTHDNCQGKVSQFTVSDDLIIYTDDYGDIEGPYIYMESNGVEGLQQGGTGGVPGAYEYEAPCQHDNPDQLVY